MSAVALVAVFVQMVAAGVAAAQVVTAEDPTPFAKAAALHFGPIAVNPGVKLGNVGVDTNVFNEPDTFDPKSDFTFTLAPKADVWMRVGPSWLMISGTEEVVYYSRYANQRSGNHRYSAAWRLGWNRLVIVPNFNYASLRDRPGFEIDARSRRAEKGGGMLAAYRLGSKTSVQARFDHTVVDFAEEAVFRGDSLRLLLNRTIKTGGLEFRYRVTPLTTVGLDAHRQEDRFAFSPFRNSDSTRISGTIELDPFALIKGRASIGYRSFKPLSPSVAEFSGLTGALNLSYVAFQSTLFTVQGIRDVQYSYDITRPYYLQTGITGSVTQHLFGPVQVAARLGHQRLAYRGVIVNGMEVGIGERPDMVRTLGASIGYRLGRTMTISLDADHQQRLSPRESQEYEGLRTGVSVTYAF